MAEPKTYEITTVVTEWKRTRMYYSKGTLKELIEATRNTFEAGHKSNPKINLAPKSIKSFASIILKNPYFEEEIKVKESYKHITDMLGWLEVGNIQCLKLQQIEPTETMITLHPKHFGKIEFYEEEDK